MTTRINSSVLGTLTANLVVDNTLRAQGVYDEGKRVLSTTSGPGNLTITGNSVALTSFGPGAITSGAANRTQVVTVDQFGRVVTLSNTLISIPGTQVTSMVTDANVALYTQLTNTTVNAIHYLPVYNKATGNATAYTNTQLSFNPATGNISATGFIGTHYGNVVGTTTTLSGRAFVGNLITTNGVFWANGQAYSSGGGGGISTIDVKNYLTNFDGNIIPSANITYSLGNETHWWTELWVSSNTIYIGGKPLTVNPANNVITYNNKTIGGAQFTESPTAPSSPNVGDQWYDTDTDVLYEYMDHGPASAWIDITGPAGIAGIPGIQGEQGDPGANGTSVTIVGSVADPESLPSNLQWGNLVAGSGVITQTTGNLWVYDGSLFTDVGTIRGPQGPTGATGPQGETGPRGEQGEAGNNGADGTNYLNFGNITANANLNLTTGTLSFSSYNGVVIGISSNTANIGLAGNITLSSVTSKFAEPVITGTVPSNYTPDWDSGSIHNYTAAQNFTLNAPINMPVGASMTIVITQDGTGSRSMTANSYYKFASNIKTLSTGANSVDMMNFVRTGDNTYLTVLTKGYA